MSLRRFYYQKIRHYCGEMCDDCDNPVAKKMGSYWTAPDDMWNKVVGNNTTILCPGCFFWRATYNLVPIHWEAVETV